MKLVYKAALVREGEDGFYRIYTHMCRDIYWVQGRFVDYEEAKKEMRRMNRERTVKAIESRKLKQKAGDPAGGRADGGKC